MSETREERLARARAELARIDAEYADRPRARRLYRRALVRLIARLEGEGE